MWEFEFWDEDNCEQLFFYGYNYADMRRRNPDVNFEELILTRREYVD